MIVFSSKQSHYCLFPKWCDCPMIPDCYVEKEKKQKNQSQITKKKELEKIWKKEWKNYERKFPLLCHSQKLTILTFNLTDVFHLPLFFWSVGRWVGGLTSEMNICMNQLPPIWKTFGNPGSFHSKQWLQVNPLKINWFQKFNRSTLCFFFYKMKDQYRKEKAKYEFNSKIEMEKKSKEIEKKNKVIFSRPFFFFAAVFL